MYREQQILAEFSSTSIEILNNRYTKQQLIDMYIQIYGNKPLSSMNKTNIIKVIKNRASTLARAEAFRNI